MSSKNFVGTALAVLVSAAVFAGCGGPVPGATAPPTTAGSPQPGAAQSGHNAADIAFAQQMIPHHAQALDMSALVPSRTTNAKVIDLARRIQQAQDPEIRLMTDWLGNWGAAPAATGMPGMTGMTGAMPGMTGGAPMAGMMSAQEMQNLGGLTGAAFDRMWLDMMIRHHQGALDMSHAELAQGTSADAMALARKIIDGQQKEITEMRGLLGS